MLLLQVFFIWAWFFPLHWQVVAEAEEPAPCVVPRHCSIGFACVFNSTGACTCTCHEATPATNLAAATDSPPEATNDGPLLRRPCTNSTQCPPFHVCFAGDTWAGFCVHHHNQTKKVTDAPTKPLPSRKKLRHNKAVATIQNEAKTKQDDSSMDLFSLQQMRFELGLVLVAIIVLMLKMTR
ncbi:hypothetical protein LEN26_001848 [Aphanomyces euteiches]|nr:hypothetical protein AeMF1_021340 [Aphanomyces euteiches]KAH9160456.1 hypothetical protein LEN26_001848 [Aphanomyces euteiches]KAH9187118.1 hypothetical protein AeNC1_010905 [Aphanomyces euteiches]